MSAYVQSNDHIDLLVSYIRRWDVTAYHLPPGANPVDMRATRSKAIDADDLGRELLGENILSVQHNYPSMDDSERADYAARVLPYRWQSVSGVELGEDDGEAVAVLKAVHGYIYQSCDHPDWKASQSYAWMRALERAAMRRLPGYDQAQTWSFSRHASHAAA